MLSKGQVSSIDVLLAFLIFALVMGLFYTTLGSHTPPTPLNALGMRIALHQVLERPGVPEVWNASTVTTLGFASSWRELNVLKLGEFMNLTSDPTRAKELLVGPVAAVSFNLSYANGTTVYINTTAFAGNVSWQNGVWGENVFVARTWAVLNQQPVRAELRIS